MPQVHVAGPRVAGVIPDARELGQADPGRPEYRDHRGVAALLERPARAGAPALAGRRRFKDRHGPVWDVRRRPQPGHRVRSLLLGGQPLEELLQGAELAAGVRGVGYRLPAGPIGLPAQVGGGNHCTARCVSAGAWRDELNGADRAVDGGRIDLRQHASW